MKRIELTADEIKVINQQLNGEIEINTATPEQQDLLSGVVDKATDLLDETEDYDGLEASDDDLVKWFYGKYQDQQGDK